jgi:hypothetical protein
MQFSKRGRHVKTEPKRVGMTMHAAWIGICRTKKFTVPKSESSDEALQSSAVHPDRHLCEIM